VAQKTSRKRRKERRRAPASRPSPVSEPRGYARGRAKDEEVRRSLKPLAPGERPTAVTVAAVAAVVLAVANVVAIGVGWDGITGSDRGQAVAGSLLVTVLLCVMAYGMWRARYWAVLGMQTILVLTILFATLGVTGAGTAYAVILLLLIATLAGILFWYLVKAMARIQMPQRPGADG
jgi:hypothetical protein